ncbi:MAG: hypothetical protein Q8P84_04085 [Deltaproteobacteria bacterium]|nr:hypothetical protein [Deltaproteobacteria bacterium]
MKIRRREAEKGSMTVEFMAVMPFFVFLLAALVAAALWIFKAQMAHLKAYGKARKAAVYMAQDGRFSKVTVPFQPALKGLSLDLNNQGQKDADFKITQMDNGIGFCGNDGDYKLCGR